MHVLITVDYLNLTFFSNYMIYLEKPADFKPKFKVVTCYLTHRGKFLILKRSKEESYPEQWCAPGGKLENGENRRKAIVREIEEETGIMLNKHKIDFIKTVFVKYPDFDFEFSMFRADLESFPEIILDEDQQDYAWVTPEESLSYDLVPDEAECIKLSFNI
jgi:8-oxo-dGTP diphosphatase